jgi:hypothetical protein
VGSTRVEVGTRAKEEGGIEAMDVRSVMCGNVLVRGKNRRAVRPKGVKEGI